MEAYEVVEALQNLWSSVPESVPLQARRDSGKMSYVLLLLVGDLQVYAELQVGAKGGIQEIVYVVDPSQAIVADKLIVRCFDGGDARRGAIFPLAELRHTVLQASSRRRELAMELCENALWELLDGPPLNPRVLRHIPSTSQSLRGVAQGGIPTQGRRGGGAPGGH